MISIGQASSPASGGNSSGGMSISEVNSAIDSKLESSVKSDTGTSGTSSKNALNVTVSPTGNSSRVVIGDKVEVSYNSNFNIVSGGWLTANQSVVNTAGSGTIDKIVGDMNQMNLTGGNVAAAVGYEPVLSNIGANTLVGGFAGYYFPNLAAVPNIGNVQKFAALQNDEPRAHILNRGRYLNGDEVEIPPPYHIGMSVGRYYSAPAKSMTQNAIVPNVIYVTYVHVPSRAVITKLGFNVVTGAAGNARLGLYKVVNSMITSMVAQTGNIATNTAGAKEGTVSAAVDAGTYALVAVFSANPVINWHEIASHPAIGSMTPTGYSENSYITPFPFAALPAVANIVPTFAANTIEPHLWFRL